MNVDRDHSADPIEPGLADVDYNDPSICARPFGPDKFSISDYKSPAEVRHEANERSSKLLASYNTLSEIFRRHEATIQKRWTKRTTQ